MSKDPPTNFLYEKKIKSNNLSAWVGMNEGLELVRNGKYAFFCEGNTPYKIIASKFRPSEICDTNALSLRTETLTGFLSRRDSPFLQAFKIRSD